jgi:DNA-binding MarR family transcriptional regulator
VLEYDWDSSVGTWVCLTSQALRRAFSARLAQVGITLRQWEVLAWLSSHGASSQAEIAEGLGIEAPTLAGIVTRMERDGWLERKACSNDRRKNRLFATEQADAVWNRAVQECNIMRDQMTSGLSDAELKQFKRTCERIRENMAAAADTVLDLECFTETQPETA